MSDETTEIDQQRAHIIVLCDAIQAKIARPMTPEQMQCVLRDLTACAAIIGADPRAVDSFGAPDPADIHQKHDLLASLLEEEFHIARADDQIEADTLS